MQRQDQQDWPAVLFFTPETWCPIVRVHVVDGDELHRLITKDIRSFNAQPWDATPIHLVKVLDEKFAIYELKGDSGSEFYQIRRYRIPGGGALYEWELLDGGSRVGQE